MPVHEARIPGFHKHSLTERHRILSENTSIPIDEITRALHGGGIDPETADKIVENVVGTYALPFGLALNFLINGTPYIVPMVVEEPSVIAAATANATRPDIMLRTAVAAIAHASIVGCAARRDNGYASAAMAMVDAHSSGSEPISVDSFGTISE